MEESTQEKYIPFLEYMQANCMSTLVNEKKAALFKVLANPIRLDIVDTLLEGEKCVCEIIEELKKYEQSHISKSLKKLKSVGLIQDRKEGVNVYYSLKVDCLREFFACLERVLAYEANKHI